MSQFSANIKAILDTKGIPSQIKKIENDTSITLKKFSLDTSGLPSQIQASLDKHKFTINLDGIKTGNLTTEMKTKGAQTGQAFSQSLMGRINKDVNTGALEASLSRVQQRFNALSASSKNISMLPLGSDTMEKYTQIEGHLARMAELQAALKAGGLNDGQIVAYYTEYNTLLSMVRNNLQTVTDATRQFASATQIATLQNKMETFLNSNTKAAKVYGNQVRALNDELKILISQGGVSTDALGRISGQYGDIDREATRAGLKVKSFGTTIKNAFTSISRYIGTSTLIYSAFRAVRDVVKNVSDLDTAMASLRKVSDATDSEYKAFFERSKKNAVEYATSLKDIISSTADFSRLGYSLADSEELAKVASVYNEIGDIDNIEKATQSIVSSFAAFKKEGLEAIDIADKFNEVGK